MKTFDYVISLQPVVINQALAKRFVDSGIRYPRLNNLFETHGEKGLLAILTNDKSIDNLCRNTKKCAGGATDPLALNLIQFPRSFQDTVTLKICSLQYPSNSEDSGYSATRLHCMHASIIRTRQKQCGVACACTLNRKSEIR